MNINTNLPPVSIRTFEPVSLKRTLEDNSFITVPESKILVIDKAPKEACLLAEIGMTINPNLPAIATQLFKDTIGDQHEGLKFGTLGMFGLGVSPEDHKFGIVSNEPIYLSLNNPITFKVTASDIASKLIHKQIPNPLVINKGESILFKDINFYPSNCVHGVASRETKKELETRIGAKFNEVIRSLPPEIRLNLCQNRTVRIAVEFSDDPCKIERTREGILVTSTDKYLIGFVTLAMNTPIFNYTRQ